jgi:hypothetical protein
MFRYLQYELLTLIMWHKMQRFQFRDAEELKQVSTFRLLQFRGF